jgi:hypothetical protein
MRAVSQKFLAAVGESHRMASRARVLPPGYNGVTPPLQNIIPIETGSVTFDVTAQIQGSVTLDTAQSWPVNSQDLCTPYGNEVFLERGVVYGDGSAEWVSLGYYRINSVEQKLAPYGALTLTCQDRMAGLIDAKIISPITFAAGTTVISMIESLVTSVYPWVVIDYDSSLNTATINVTQTTTDDRYGFIDSLVKSYGMIWYWDYRGYLYIHVPPSLNTPVLTINSGRNGVLSTMDRTLDRQLMYNGCVASGQQAAATTPPIATVIDGNPSSPTYWYGQFGQVPQFYSSSFLTTTDQCTAAATALLLQSTGLPYEVDFGIVPNPALALWDPVTITYQGGTYSENHIIKQLIIGLSAKDLMTAKTRQMVTGSFHSI